MVVDGKINCQFDSRDRQRVCWDQKAERLDNAMTFPHVLFQYTTCCPRIQDVKENSTESITSYIVVLSRFLQTYNWMP